MDVNLHGVIIIFNRIALNIYYTDRLLININDTIFYFKYQSSIR
jgi:hypothetical protein